MRALKNGRLRTRCAYFFASSAPAASLRTAHSRGCCSVVAEASDASGTVEAEKKG
jgi:hypothetical protein